MGERERGAEGLKPRKIAFCLLGGCEALCLLRLGSDPLLVSYATRCAACRRVLDPPGEGLRGRGPQEARQLRLRAVLPERRVPPQLPAAHEDSAQGESESTCRKPVGEGVEVKKTAGWTRRSGRRMEIPEKRQGLLGGKNEWRGTAFPSSCCSRSSPPPIRWRAPLPRARERYPTQRTRFRNRNDCFLYVHFQETSAFFFRPAPSHPNAPPAPRLSGRRITPCTTCTCSPSEAAPSPP